MLKEENVRRNYHNYQQLLNLTSIIQSTVNPTEKHYKIKKCDDEFFSETHKKLCLQDDD